MMECIKIPAGVRKAKKKQVKDELVRIKQAEKKKRRLEKALATSAAIRSELEKKKQKKKEEQERLDEEGAAIAEAMALHVLLGEDSDDSSKVMLKKHEGLTLWDHARNIDIVFGRRQWDHARNIDIVFGRRQPLSPYHDLSQHSLENIEWVSNAPIYGQTWNHWENSVIASDPLGQDFYHQCFEGQGWGSAGLSTDLVAAQAVSSLQIADDARIDAYVFNPVLRG